MHRRAFAVAAVMTVLFAAAAFAQETVQLFNGKDLSGWRGNAKLWSVQDGAITGITTAEDPISQNTFLIYEKPVDDFELTFRYRIVGGNSGVQYRSKVLDEKQFVVGGYQADFEAGTKFSGINYEEKLGRGILANRGERVTIDREGKKTVEKFAESDDLQKHIKPEQWNEYRITARGPRMTHEINGQLMSELIDRQEGKSSRSGVLALQVHKGPPMKVQFKDLVLKKLAAREGKGKGKGKAKKEDAKPQTAGAGDAPAATPAEALQAPDGFKIDLLYSVPRDEQGSWVAMAFDDKGRLITSDQYGTLYRVTLPPAAPGSGAAKTKVEKLGVQIGGAQGLLHAFDSLYVVVSQRVGEYGQGLYRVRDTNGDDQYDKIELLREFKGSGEHGPHAVVLSPDGKRIFVVAGNHTDLPEPVDVTRQPRVWDEDQLLPRMWDARGHARGKLAPGGWIAITDPEGKHWELFSSGYRNEYDIAFNADGELFTFDSDMEWDIGSPWYRPTRINHATSGSEFGWRSGTGKWPAYYPDSLPAVADIGVGSPTGVTFGYGAKFPEPYQRALYALDWSYGNIYAVHLKPAGSSYDATVEKFITGKPLPVTDMLVNPRDGAMYFTIGGRKTQSGLYRVTYPGFKGKVLSDAQLKQDGGEEARALRHKLEAFHGKQDPKAVENAWKHLSSPDRFLRYAARIAIENQPVAQWQDRALRETDPQAALEALLALTRHGDKALQPKLLAALDRLPWDSLNEAQKLALLRVYGLAFIRMGAPDAATAQAIGKKFMQHYPSASRALNIELSRMLAYLETPGVIEKTLDLQAKAPTQEEQIHYAYVLRPVKSGWTPELRRRYFDWFNKAGEYRGGASFGGFLTNIKNEALEHVSEADKAALADVLSPKASEATAAAPIAPRSFVKNYTVADLAGKLDKGLKNRDFANGRAMFAAASCFACHRFAGEGGAVGPDLTGVGGRFSPRDLLESTIEPSKVISDQYQSVIFTMTDGSQVVGRIMNLNGDKIMVNTNMLDPGQSVNVDRTQVANQIVSPVSLMPPGLLNTLTEQDVLDLMAYLLSGGNKADKMFK